jgi:hypothetical protein
MPTVKIPSTHHTLSITPTPRKDASKRKKQKMLLKLKACASSGDHPAVAGQLELSLVMNLTLRDRSGLSLCAKRAEQKM